MQSPLFSKSTRGPAEAGGSHESRQPAPTLISIPCLDSYSFEELKEAGEALSRRHSVVWQLAETGKSADAIAKSTGRPIGEVELILALRNRIQAMAASNLSASEDSRG